MPIVMLTPQLKRACYLALQDGGINLDYLGENYPDATLSDGHKWVALGNCANDEKFYPSYKTFRALVHDWLQGVPSAVKTPFESYRIYEFGYANDLLDKDADDDTHVFFENAYWLAMADVIATQYNHYKTILGA